MNHHQANELPDRKQRAREIIEQLTKLDNSKKPGGGIHGQVIGCEPYVIRTTGDGLQCLWEAGVLLDELLDPFDRRAPAPTSEPGARELLQEFVDYHSKPAGMTVDIALDVDQLGDFLAGVEAKEKAMVERAVQLLATPASPAVPDIGLDQALTKRDEYHDIADKLAEAIADHLGIDIGEHSSDNCPWQAALGALDVAPALPSPAPVAPKPAMSKFATVEDYRAAVASFDKRMEDPLTQAILEQTGELPPAASPLVDEAKQIVAGKVEP